MAASAAPTEGVQTGLQRRRRRHRRRQDKPAISARLVLDDHVRGDVGILSEDLFADLFPHLHQQEQEKEGDGFASSLSLALSAAAPAASTADPEVYHVAIAPWAPHASAEGTDWAVVPVAKSSALAHSTVQFSPSSLALQSFAAILQQVAPSKLSGHSRRGIEILLLDVEAVALDTIFVSLEGDLTQRLENGEGTFFREHPANGSGSNSNGNSNGVVSPEDRLAAALRVALGTLPVVHAGDLFPLPLPPHPITHVPPNPGKVVFCEPVAQGVLSARTKVVVSRGRMPARQHLAPPNRKLNGVAAEEGGSGGGGDDDGNDTANDQFYSAAEERSRTTATEDSEADNSDSENELSAAAAESDSGGEISDDSMDEMISLQAPTLPATVASGVSTLQPGSPMTVGRGRRIMSSSTTNGLATPGSVFSSFTATTARPDRPKGRLFKAQGLTTAIPAELLHPKPAAEDDEEARVYVDVNHLTRIGCFSGDWVRLEAAAEPPVNGFGRFALGSFGTPGLGDGDGEGEADWRPARVFGLPEGYAQRPVTRIPSAKHDKSSDGRRLSFFESQIVQRPLSPLVYASPILLANMQSTPYLRLSPLKGAQPLRHGGRSAVPKQSMGQPPFAQKVVIQQVRTPVPIQKAVQAAVVAGLKSHFEKKLRVVKAGDFVAIPIDAQLGRTMHELAAGGGEATAVADIVSMTKKSGSSSSSRPDEVAWFKVSHVQAQVRAEDAEDESPWGRTACVDIATAHLEQSGTTTTRVPGTQNSSWPYYLCLRAAPQPRRRLVGGAAGERGAAPAAVVEPERGAVSGLRRQLRELMAAATSQRAMHLGMPAVAVLLVSTQRGIGKATVARQACADLGLHAYAVDAYDVLNEAGAGGSDAKTEGVLRARAGLAMSCGADCCALLIRHLEALTADRMVATMQGILDEARVVVATTTEPDKIPDGVRSLFTHELEMHAPDERERAAILRSIVAEGAVALDADVDLSSVALKTAALVAGDLADVVERALVCRQRRLEAVAGSQLRVQDVLVAGGSAVRGLTQADLDAAVEAARKNFADAIGAPKIPNVTWSDVGGLDNVKDVVMETIQLPLERPELFARGMKKRSGILFYGPPGTGKTLLAKAIATEYSLNFFSVKGPELLNMYIGESEANVRRVFQRARDARPCVVFFDELDSVAPKRGNQGDSGGVMDRIVSQLLAELDGMSGGGEDGDADEDESAGAGAAGGGGVFVIGATNRPDLLDPALLRPGRFDTMLYLGVSDTHDKQLRILEALTRKFTLHPTVSLRAVAQTLPFTFTGADFYALCSDAMLKAVTRQASQVDARIAALQTAGQPPMTTAYYFDHHATADDVAVVVTEQDFADAHHELVPSISAGELAHYERVRATFEGVKAEKNAEKTDSAENAENAESKRRRRKGKAAMRFSDVEEEDENDDDDDDDDGKNNEELPLRNGKAKAVAAFAEQHASDDEALYG